jgi:protein-S-isoprenylcysteine O-methyltransferase Ste14
VNGTATAGVIARPPVLFVAALLLGLVSDRLLSLPFPVSKIDLVHWIIAGSLIFIGLALGAAAIRNFSRARTPVPTIQPTRTLVTTGIHGWTRNPIYLGMFLLYVGIGIAVRNSSILILTRLLQSPSATASSHAKRRTWNGDLETPTGITKSACAAGCSRRQEA